MAEKKQELAQKMAVTTRDGEEDSLLPAPVEEGQQNALAYVEKSRVMQEVQGALIIAQRFPRDVIRAETRILKECERLTLAKKATYLFPRGGERITGPSIRLAEAIARNWGNLSMGFKEISRRDGRSEVVAFAWDQETNARFERQFIVEHRIKLKSGQMKHLTDPRDIYEKMANEAQRRLRSLILELIPMDLVESAVNRCKKALDDGEKVRPMAERVRDCLLAFEVHGVKQTHIEKFLGHPMEAVNGPDLVDLQGVLNAIKEGANRKDYFDLGEVDSVGGTAEALSNALSKVEKKP